VKKNDPVERTLGDGDVQRGLAETWNLPEEEIDTALRITGLLVETHTYHVLREQLARHEDERISKRELTGMLVTLAEARLREASVLSTALDERLKGASDA
jgi:hypothetical protein